MITKRTLATPAWSERPRIGRRCFCGCQVRVDIVDPMMPQVSLYLDSGRIAAPRSEQPLRDQATLSFGVQF
jgi:hypothetical protein